VGWGQRTKLDFCLTYRAMKHFCGERCGRWAIRDNSATCLPYFSVYIYIYIYLPSMYALPTIPSTTNLILCFDTCPLLYIIQAKRESFSWGTGASLLQDGSWGCRYRWVSGLFFCAILPLDLVQLPKTIGFFESVIFFLQKTAS